MPVGIPGRLVLALCLAAACAPPAATPSAATAADTAAVNAARELETVAVATGDTTLGYLADDIMMMPPNELAVTGIPSVRAWLGGLMKQFKASVAYSNTSVVFSGDLAVEHYNATFTLTPLAGGPAVIEPLKGLHVYRRDAAGGWKMVQDIWNSDAPVAPPAPAPKP